MNSTIVADTIVRPGHKSIGNNGSFWLPPEVKNQEFHKLLPADAKSSTKTDAKPSSENLINSFSHSKNSSLSNKNVLHIDKPLRNQAVIPVQKENQYLQTTIPPSVTLVHPSNSLNRSRLNPINSLISQYPNVPEPTHNVPFQLVHLNYHTTPIKRKQVEVATRDGTKNAFSDADADYYRKESERTFHYNSRVQRGEFILDEVASVLFSAHPEKFNMLSLPEGQVVRFAVDLPNGCPVSVRIFSNSKRIQVSFICTEKQAFDYISSTFFSPKINSSMRNELPVEISLFSSFAQLDMYNHD